jgi:hypothetical protein
MKTKRVNNEFHRLDVKLPIDVYSQISEIAVNNFNARVHHISGKPEIASTLIYLLQLGIESFTEGSELIKKSNTDNLTDTIPITNQWVKELIKDELIPVQSKLDELSELVYRYKLTDNEPIKVNTDTDTNTDNLIDADTDNLTSGNSNDSNLIASDSIIDVIPSQDTNNNSDTEPSTSDNEDNEDVTAKSTLLESPIVVINEVLEVKLPLEVLSESESDISEIGTLTQAIDNVILPEKAKGNNNHSAIARMLHGKYSTSMTDKRTNWKSRNVSLALQYRSEGKA